MPFALESIHNQEVSSNAGGLIVWPAKVLIPLGFLMLTLQGLSELIKRVGYLMGLVDASAFEKQATTPEEEIEAIKAGGRVRLGCDHPNYPADVMVAEATRASLQRDLN